MLQTLCNCTQFKSPLPIIYSSFKCYIKQWLQCAFGLTEIIFWNPKFFHNWNSTVLDEIYIYIMYAFIDLSALVVNCFNLLNKQVKNDNNSNFNETF